MKRYIFLLVALLSLVSESIAQDQTHFEKIIKELSSAKYQGRGYANDGVRKAATYIKSEFAKAGADEVTSQSFTLDINTFPGKMEVSVDGFKLVPGVNFVMREYSPGAHGSGKLYYIDTLAYDSAKIFADLAKEENRGCYVVCDFWFTYQHSDDFKKMERSSECLNAGMVYVWDTPLKFYKAYGEKVTEKPVIWVAADFPRDANKITVDVDNKFLDDYKTENVIAKVKGANSDKCIVFTAHYDHLGNLGSKLYYPGANDNASGTAGIITLAEYYAQNRPEYDMYFIAFSGEDANLRGSEYFVENPVMPLSDILYLFNLDMIGDNNPVQYCEVSGPGLKGYVKMEVINRKIQAFEALERGELAANSDHWPFAQKGVPCVLFENQQGEAFEYYHSHLDNIKTVKFTTFAPLMKLITTFVKEL